MDEQNEQIESENIEVIDKTKNNKKTFVFIIIGIIFIVIAISITLLVLFNFNQKKCPSDYKLLDDKCTKIETIKPKEDKYCLDGYQLENDICYKTEIVAPTLNYYCPDTYRNDNDIVRSKSTLSGDVCSYTMSHNPVQRKSCLPGAVPYNDTKCRATIPLNAASRTDVYTGKIMYYCPADQVLSGTTCLMFAYSDYVYENVCADGYSLINGKCVKYFTYEASWNANCPSGYTFVDKNTCTKKITTNVKYNYECPSDYKLVDKTCQKKIYLNDN